MRRLFSLALAYLLLFNSMTVFAASEWKIDYTDNYALSGGNGNFKFTGITEAPYWTARNLDAFSFNTRQVGVYSPKYLGVPTTPKRIIVHNPPVARMGAIQLTAAGARYSLSFTTNSYDPDVGDTRTDKGIVKEYFQLRAAGISSNTWSDATYTKSGNTVTITNLNAAAQYEFAYFVEDYQGELSPKLIKFISTNTNNTDIKPIASFSFITSKVSIFEWSQMIAAAYIAGDYSTILQDSSYDPMGYTVNSWKWSWVNSDGTPIGTPHSAAGTYVGDSLRFRNFLLQPASGAYPVGSYYLCLTVQRGGSVGTVVQRTSEEYRRVIDFSREAFSLWFSDLYAHTSLTGSADIPNPPSRNMKGYNLNTLEFAGSTGDSHTARRAVTYNALKSASYTTITKRATITDGSVKNSGKDFKVNLYPLELNQEFVWPVTATQLNATNQEAMISIWGTPTGDWGFAPTNDDAIYSCPAYIKQDVNYYIPQVITWGTALNKYGIFSTNYEDYYEFSVRTPNNNTSSYRLYSPELARTVYDWETDTTTTHTGNYSKTGERFKISIPSRLENITLRGTGGGTSDADASRVGGVYFRETNSTSLTDAKLGYVYRSNSSALQSFVAPEKGMTRTVYLYVQPETSLVTGETFTESGLTTTATYVDDVFATSRTPIDIYRYKDDSTMRANGSLVTEANTVRNLIAGETSAALALEMIDPNASIKGYRINGSSTFIRINSRAANIVVPLTPGTHTVDVLVRPEDPELQRQYTFTYNVTDIAGELDAVVNYKTADGTSYPGIYTAGNSTFTVTLPASVRQGKLSIAALNSGTLIEQINNHVIGANAVDWDVELPNLNNNNSNFRVRSTLNKTKTYTVRFVKSLNPPTVILDNAAQLTGYFSPQGRYDGITFVEYKDITDAPAGYSGNGVPIAVTISGVEPVQGVKAEIIFDNQIFPVHWGGFDGETYLDGAETLEGYATISKEALQGKNGAQTINYAIYQYDSPEGAPVHTDTGTFTQTLLVDSQGPTLDITNESYPSAAIRLTNMIDNLTFAKEASIRWGETYGSGLNETLVVQLAGETDVRIPVGGATSEMRFTVTVTDILGNITIVPDFVLNFSDTANTPAHMEFGRNTDGYYINIRKEEGQSVGLDRFGFVS